MIDAMPQPEERFSLVLQFERSERSFELEPEGRLHVGRHESNDVVIDDDSVSRFHAIVWWNEILDRPVLQDCGSKNGTYLDGVPTGAEPVSLGGGELLQVGKVRLVVELRCDGVSAPALLPEDEDGAVLFSDRGPDLQTFAPDRSAVHRQLLAVEHAERTGVLTVTRSGFEVSLTFCLGRVVAASCGELDGRRALAAALGSEGGLVSFRREFEPVEAAFDVSVQRLLAARGGKQETRHYTTPLFDPSAWEDLFAGETNVSDPGLRSAAA